MHSAVCPGSFDPITTGHLDVVAAASGLFDEVTVAVVVNPSKQSLFSVEERLAMLAEVTAEFLNVHLDSFDGLLVDFCRDRGIGAIVRGLRAVMDFDYELQMAQMNRRLAGVETIFIPTLPEHSFVAASLVKEVASLGGDVKGLLPPPVLHRLLERLGPRDASDG